MICACFIARILSDKLETVDKDALVAQLDRASPS